MKAYTILIKVSSSSDATGTWYSTITLTAAGRIFPDQPQVGIESNVFAISANDFKGNTLEYSQYWILNKSQMITGAATVATDTFTNPLQSVHPISSTVPLSTLYLVSDGAGGASSLAFISVNGTPPAALTTTETNLTLNPVETLPPEPVPALGGSVDDDDGRIESGTYYQNTVWATATDGCNGGFTCVRIFGVNVSTDTFVQDFDWESSPGMYDYYPALAVDRAGNLGVAFSNSSSTTYASMMITARAVSDPSGTLEAPVLVARGQAAASGGGGLSGSSRFGDYSGVALDPVDGGTFWGAGEYIGSTGGLWSTWIQPFQVMASGLVSLNRSAVGEVNYALTFNAHFSGGAPPYTATWIWGDGTAKTVQTGLTSSPATVTHTFTSPSAPTYVVRVFLNSSMASANDSVNITVYPHVQAAFTPSRPTSVVPANETFTSASSGGFGSYSYSWSFGDGNSSTAASPPFQTYYTPGTYLINLTVTDALGYRSTATFSLTVWGTLGVNLALFSGWNLVALPQGYNDYTLYELAQLLGNRFQFFEAMGGAAFTNYSLPGNSGNGSTAVSAGNAVWIEVSANTTLTLWGNSTASIPGVPLASGWSSIGWSVTTATNASALAQSITGATAVSVWNASSQQWITYIVGFSPSIYDFTVTAGEGVMIWTPAGASVNE